MQQSPPNTQKTFPIFLSFQAGLHNCIAHARPLVLMSIFPFIALTALILVKQTLPDTASPVITGIILLPAQFLLSVVMALLLRWFVLDEHPTSNADRMGKIMHRNLDIRDSAGVNTAVTFVLTGALTLVMLWLAPQMQAAQNGADINPATSFLSLTIMGVMIYLSRFLWLNIPVALGFDVPAFYQTLGGMIASLKIFILYALCSFVSALPFDLVRVILSAALPDDATAGQVNPVLLVLDSLLTAGGIVAQALVFTCASAAAIRALLGKAITK